MAFFVLKSDRGKSGKPPQYAPQKIFKGDDTMPQQFKMDDIKRMACEMMVSGSSRKDVAEACSVNESTVYRWTRQPLFNDYLIKLAEEQQRAALVPAYSQLLRILHTGKNHEQLKAIELVLRNQGRLKEVKEVSQSTTVTADIDIEKLFKDLGV